MPDANVGSPVQDCPLATLEVRVERYPAVPATDEAFESKVTVTRLVAPDKDKVFGGKTATEAEATIEHLPPGKYVVTCDPPKAKFYEFDAHEALQIDLVKTDPPTRHTLRIRIPEVQVLKLRLFRGSSTRAGPVAVEFVDAGGGTLLELKKVALASGLIDVQVRKDIAAKIKAAKIYFLKANGEKSKQQALYLTFANGVPDFTKPDVLTHTLRNVAGVNADPLDAAHALDQPRTAGAPPAQWEIDLAWARLLRERNVEPAPWTDASAPKLKTTYYAYSPGRHELPLVEGPDDGTERVVALRAKLWRGTRPRTGTASVTVVAKDGTYIDEQSVQVNAGLLEIRVPKARAKDVDHARVRFSRTEALLLVAEDQAGITPDAKKSRILRNLGERGGDALAAAKTLEDPSLAWDHHTAFARLWSTMGEDVGAADGVDAKLLTNYHAYEAKDRSLPVVEHVEPDRELVKALRVRLVRGENDRAGVTYDAVVESKDGTYLHEATGLAAADGLLEIPVPKARLAEATLARVYVVRNRKRVHGFLAHIEKPAELSAEAKVARILHNLGFSNGVPADDKLRDPLVAWAQLTSGAAAFRSFGADLSALGAHADELQKVYVAYASKTATLPTIEFVAEGVDLTTLIRLAISRGGKAVEGEFAAEIYAADGTMLHDAAHLHVQGGVLEIPVPKARAKTAKEARLYRIKNGRRVEGLLVHLEDPGSLTPDAAATRILRNLGVRGGDVLAPTARASDAQVAWLINIELALSQREAGQPVTALSEEVATHLGEHYRDWKPRTMTLENPGT